MQLLRRLEPISSHRLHQARKDGLDHDPGSHRAGFGGYGLRVENLGSGRCHLFRKLLKVLGVQLVVHSGLVGGGAAVQVVPLHPPEEGVLLRTKAPLSCGIRPGIHCWRADREGGLHQSPSAEDGCHFKHASLPASELGYHAPCCRAGGCRAAMPHSTWRMG